MDVIKFLSDLKDDLKKAPDTEGLKEIRKKLDDAALIPEIKDYLKSTNNSAPLLNGITDLRRLADDLNAKRATQKAIFVGITGTGCAAAVGSVVLIITLPTGAFLLPWFVGAVVAVHGGISAVDTSEEERMYQQIHERLNIDKVVSEMLK